jgi:hypothetical protein
MVSIWVKCYLPLLVFSAWKRIKEVNMGQEKLLELLNTYAKSSYEIDDNFTLDYIKEKIQLLDAWIQDNIEKTPRDLFRLTEE